MVFVDWSNRKREERIEHTGERENRAYRRKRE